MSKTVRDCRFGDPVQVRRATQDGDVWQDAVVCCRYVDGRIGVAFADFTRMMVNVSDGNIRAVPLTSRVAVDNLR